PKSSQAADRVGVLGNLGATVSHSPIGKGKGNMMASLSGKVAIVTGSSRGIGQAIAERLAQDGAIVVVNYIASVEKARQVVTDIQAKGGKAVAVQSDMSRVAEVRRLVIETVKQFGRLDILINNAGRFMPKSILETTEADFDQIIALNAKGPYFAMQE